MSGVEILIDRRGLLVRAAVLRDGRLDDLQVDRTDRPTGEGDLILGKLDRVLADRGAAFVLLQAGTPAGFLPVAEAGVNPAGQPLLVQVRAPGTGAKGPLLTRDLTLSGRFLIHRPLGQGVAASKRLADSGRRAALLRLVKALPEPGGWIIRSGAAAAEEAAIRAEAAALATAWAAVAAAATSGRSPRMIATGPDAAIRCLIEHGAAAAVILVGDRDLAATCRRWMATMAPDLVDRLEIASGPPTLFEARGLEEAFEALLEPLVPLPVGGSLIIEGTAALTAIDVNGGERGNLLALNLEAAREVGRQMRLRNLSGNIVVDFPRMQRRAEADQVAAALVEAVVHDAAAPQILGWTRLGLLEIARPRRGRPLADAV